MTEKWVRTVSECVHFGVDQPEARSIRHNIDPDNSFTRKPERYRCSDSSESLLLPSLVTLTVYGSDRGKPKLL